jgi:hypothetical protein
MITIRRQLLGLGFVAASSLLALHAAQALTGPQAITIDGGPLGSLSLSGGADGYGYVATDTYNGEQNEGFDVGSALIELQKTTGVVQFTAEVGSNSYVTLGALSEDGHGHIPETSINTYSTGPLFLGYVTIAPPNSPVTVSAGEIGSLEGYESTVDWNDPTQLTTDAFYVENSNSVGVEVAGTEGPVTATVAFGDGFDSGQWNYIQALVAYTINSNNVLNVFGGYNLGRTGPGAFVYGGGQAGTPTVYENSNAVGAYYSYTLGNLNLVPEVQYVYAKVDHIVGIDKSTSNLALEGFADYAFANTPYSLGGWVEAEKSTGRYNWFAGPNSEAIGVAIAPTWQYKDLFARVNAGALYLLSNKYDGAVSYGYGSGGTSKFQFTGTLEGGLLF